MQEHVFELAEFLPYLVEAFANNMQLRADIDRRYAQEEAKYYACAVRSAHFHHYNFDLGDIQKSIYCRKTLGLLEAGVDLSYLARKGWPQIYKYVNKKNEVFRLDDFVIYMRSKMHAISLEMTNAEFSGVIYIALYLAYVFRRPLDGGLMGREFLKVIAMQDARNADQNPDEPKWENFTSEMRERTEAALAQIETHLGWPMERCQVFERVELPLDLSLELMMMSEKLDFSELGLGIKHSRQDFLECLGYLLDFSQPQEKDTANLERLIELLASGIRIKLLSRAYRELKQLYFANAKESLYALVEDLKQRLKDAEKLTEQRDYEIRQLRSEYRSGLERRLVEKDRELQRLRDELEKQRDKDKELFALREFAFSLVKEELPFEEVKRELPSIRCLIIGGHRNWQLKMRAEVPDSYIFIPAEAISFDTNLLRTADFVIINTAVLSHKLYYRVIENLPKATRLGYLSTVSIELALQELVQLMKNLP